MIEKAMAEICTATSHRLLYPIHRFIADLIDRKSLYELSDGVSAQSSQTLHGLRHTHATILIAAGIPVVTVSNRLGHSDTSTTLNIYAHALPSTERQAVEAIEKMWNMNSNSGKGDTSPDTVCERPMWAYGGQNIKNSRSGVTPERELYKNLAAGPGFEPGTP